MNSGENIGYEIKIREVDPKELIFEKPYQKRFPYNRTPRKHCTCGKCRSCVARATTPHPSLCSPRFDGWTTDENDYIRKWAGLVPAETMREELAKISGIKHQRSALYAQASRLGVELELSKLWSLADLRAFFGSDDETIKGWIRSGALAGECRPYLGMHPNWFVHPDDLRSFLRDHTDAYDPSRMNPRHPYTAYAVSCWRRRPWYTVPQIMRIISLSRSGVSKRIKARNVPFKRRGRHGGIGDIIVSGDYLHLLR